MKKICIVYGHCLAVSFIELLSKHLPFTDTYELIPYFSTSDKRPDEKYLKECSLLIYQRAALNNAAIDCINPNSQKVAYPFSTFFSLWPWPMKSPNGEWNYRVGSILIDLIQNHPDSSEDEILNLYKNIDPDNLFNLKEIYKKDVEKLKYIDDFCDAKFLDVMLPLQEEQSFFTANHLSIKQKILLLQNILKIINCPPLDDKLIEDYSKIPQQMMPVHPKIALYFKLKWAKEDTKYWCFKRKIKEGELPNYSTCDIFEWLTFDEYVKNYVKFVREK